MHIHLKKFLLEVTDNWHSDADNAQWTDSMHNLSSVIFVHRFTEVSVVMTEWVIWPVFTLLHAIMKLLLDSQMFSYCRFTALISDYAERMPSAGQTDMLHGHSSFLQKQWNETDCTVYIHTYISKIMWQEKWSWQGRWKLRLIIEKERSFVSSVMCMLNIATKLNIQHLIKLFHSSKGRVITEQYISKKLRQLGIKICWLCDYKNICVMWLCMCVCLEV
jgi:hypothetical protein